MNASTTPPKSLILIGFMGSGKSTVGRILQAKLGYPLVDMDKELETRAGKSIPRIFADDGEPAFREMESALLRELAADSTTRRIISTGGGVIGSAGNRRILQDLGYVVWLKAPVATVLERTAKNSSRPLLQTDSPEERIKELLAQREPLYKECSHLQIDTAGLDSEEVATGILECARYYFKSRT